MKKQPINCIVIEDERLAREDIVDAIEKTSTLRLLESFSDAHSAFDFLINRADVPLVFSDILMPSISGMQLLKSLANPPLFIFVTASQEYSVESFEYNVVDYIVKPYDYPRFLKAVNRAHLMVNNRQSFADTKHHIIVKNGYKNLIVRYDEILFIKADGVYVEVETVEKTHLIQISLKKMLEMLPDNQFKQVHRSYIVNLSYVEELLPQQIIMQGSIGNIPIGSSYKDALYRWFGIS